jgi:hypothetical protein
VSADKCPHCGWAPDDEAYSPPGFDMETWTDPQFMFAASATLASAMLWNVMHRDDWHDPEQDEPYERALHAACTLMGRYITNG